MPYITINQLKIFYFEHRAIGTPLLFIHGWLGSSIDWFYQYCYFVRRKHVIIIDLPGYGKSDKPKTKYSIEFFTKQILDFLKSLGYKEVILIGHSLGGMIAQNITIHHPRLVKKLILISTSASISHSVKEKFKLFWIRLIFKLAYKNFLKNIIKRIISMKNETKEFTRLYNDALKIPKPIALSTFKNMTSKFNINTELSKIYQPTLIVYGIDDRIISISNFNKLCDLIPTSERYIIKNSTHMVIVEKYREVNKAIEDFIEK